jgi:hypothetical protein
VRGFWDQLHQDRCFVHYQYVHSRSVVFSAAECTLLERNAVVMLMLCIGKKTLVTVTQCRLLPC